MTAAFEMAFRTGCLFLAYVAGGMAALVLFVLVGLAVCLIAAALFDGVTTVLRALWHRRGKPPRSRWARVIYDSRAGDV